MKPIIKWPGGKSSEVEKISNLIPKYSRYIEPFFGGGAVYFALEPEKAVINDISENLIKFYQLVKKQDKNLKKYLDAYYNSMSDLIFKVSEDYTNVLNIYLQTENLEETLNKTIQNYTKSLKDINLLVLDNEQFNNTIYINVLDKFKRTKKNNDKSEFSEEDLKDNLITGFTSGYYMYFRDVYNKINLKKIEVSEAYEVANFYYIREYCYGSMFRYNKNGEFNIPYGGISYNKKSFNHKIENIFNSKIEKLFSDTEIFNCDFEKLLLENLQLSENDFMFLDPPYDTEFSDYEGKSFDKNDQKRLAETLKKVKAKFILIIKNTDYIYNLYKDTFRILSFDKNYTYNVRSRNERNVEHLIITNIPE